MSTSVRSYNAYWERQQQIQFYQRCALGILLCLILISLPTLCSSQIDPNSPSFKYSREANENFDRKQTPPLLHGHHHHEHYHIRHDQHHQHGGQRRATTTGKQDSDMSSIWLHSVGSTLLISAAPFLLLYIIPLDNSEAMKPRLKVLLAFASGGLLGDAFLHLIPHATHPHTHGKLNQAHEHQSPYLHRHYDEQVHHDHSHDMTIGLWVLGGIIAFLIVEKLVRILKGGNAHDHSHGAVVAKKPVTSTKSADRHETDEKQPKLKEISKNTATSAVIEAESEVTIAGYLNLAADFVHNFTDGLAIGASYLAGNSIGIVTTVTILLHEVPHEIGDFAILIKSGCSRRKAMLLQLITALGAIAGTALALIGAAGTDADSAPWVLPFTAGGFIYIATVSVLPELLEESTKLKQSLKEILGLLTGVGLMVIIAKYE